MEIKVTSKTIKIAPTSGSGEKVKIDSSTNKIIITK